MRHPREASERRPVATNHHRLHKPNPAPLRAAFAPGRRCGCGCAIGLPRATKSRLHLKVGLPEECSTAIKIPTEILMELLEAYGF